MVTINMHDAKTQLSDLVARAECSYNFIQDGSNAGDGGLG